MRTNSQVILGVIVGAVVVAALVYAWQRFAVSDEPQPINSINKLGEAFQQEGNLVKDGPGFKPGVWYLIYEAPGQPGLSVELSFDANSTCVILEKSSACQLSDLQIGDRAAVEGYILESLVNVEKIIVISRADQVPDKSDLIQATMPVANQVVASPLVIAGKARGTWYFEASFPVSLYDANNKLLGSTPAQAESDWMTTEFVPFRTTLTFTKPTTAIGTLVLQKDNPSGLPEHDDELRIPVTFSTATRPIKLYYYNPNLDKDGSGNILCSANGLVSVERVIPVTTVPIQDTVRQLLRGDLTVTEKILGISTEFPLAGVELEGVSLLNGVLTLNFSDPQNRTGGGSCRVGILWAQIEATAKQFPEVKSVRFTPEELFQP
ncbi:MAG: Gmad2 immunoglobulin-like domain-containing protein [Patescibacteria group bacterium]